MKRRNVRDGRHVGGSNDVAASSSDDQETARTDDGAMVDETTTTTTTTTTTRERLRRASPRLSFACVVAVLLYPFARVAWTSTTNRGDTTTTTKVVSPPQRRPPLFNKHANKERTRDSSSRSSTTRHDHANAPSKKTTTTKSDADHDSDSNNRRVDHSNVAPPPPPPPRLVGEDAVSNLRPFLGAHRPDADAVFAFAEGYHLEVYVTFFESLRRTGFAGDVVLAVSSPAKLKPGVRDYLERRSRSDDDDESRPRLVAYSVAWTCLSKKGAPIDHVNSGFSDCTADGLYRRPTDGDGRGAPDPRPPRPVATARYELYWAWATRYGPRSRVALVDARDTFFQRNPFAGLPPPDDAATLRLYLENHEATSITRSNYNRRWIERAYGKDVVRSIANEPVVCSGSTIGDQSALESYLRLMVRQFDDTRCTMTGCDQGMHNYVRYVKLRRYDDRDKEEPPLVGGIDRVVAHEQGRGQINNLAAMRTKPLREWGVLGKDEDGEDVVLNWDGTVSPVVHQFDRDDELKHIVQRKTAAFMKEVRNDH